jgi:hypothetical protein
MHHSIVNQLLPLLLLLLLLLQASNFCSGMQCKPNRRNKTATYWLEVETPRDYNINGAHGM